MTDLTARSFDRPPAPMPAPTFIDPGEAQALRAFHRKPNIPDVPKLPASCEPVIAQYDKLAERFEMAQIELQDAIAEQRQTAAAAQLARVVAAENGDPMPAPPVDAGARRVVEAQAARDAIKVALDRAGAAVDVALQAERFELHEVATANAMDARGQLVGYLDAIEGSFAAYVEALHTLSAVDRDFVARSLPDVVIEADPEEPDRTRNLAAGLSLRDVFARGADDLLAVAPRLRFDQLRRWCSDQPLTMDGIVVATLNAALHPEQVTEQAEAVESVETATKARRKG